MHGLASYRRFGRARSLRSDRGARALLEGALTNSTDVSHFSFILIPYRFKVRDRFSAYTTCVFIEEGNFVE